MSDDIEDRIEKLEALKEELEVSRTNELLKLAGRGDGWVPGSVNVEKAQSLHDTLQIVYAAIKCENNKIPFD